MRSRDHHMAAAVDVKRRTVLVTGSIDQSEQSLQMRLQLPDSGLWTFIKAEVNLTDDAWRAWQITLGGSCKIPARAEDRMAQSRQFTKCQYIESRGTLIFSGGEVRPGEPVLKVFNVEASSTDSNLGSVIMAHKRDPLDLTQEELMVAIDKGFGADYPVLDIVVPIRIID